MDYHINRRIRLSTDRETKNLYKCSLQEFDENGQKLGNDMIPWKWSLFFTASSLSLQDAISYNHGFRPIMDSDASDEIAEKEVTQTQIIVGDLFPGRITKDGYERDPEYSMFGTDRTITKFQIQIRVMTTEMKAETCIAWGCVSYTSEGPDFLPETDPDILIFYYYVRPEAFVRYSEMIKSGSISQMSLSLGEVAGMYAEWSPSITTRNIKVLTASTEQDIENPEKLDLSLAPRLGEVREASMNFVSTWLFARPENSELSQLDDYERQDLEQFANTVIPNVTERPADAAELKKITSLVRNFGVIVIVLLVLMVFN